MIQSTTPASSTYSRSNSSQHDPSSPPHLPALAPDQTSNNNNQIYNSPPNSATRDQALNGHQYRTSTAFNPAFSTNPNAFSGPSHSAFNALAPSSNAPSQIQQLHHHHQQPQQQQQQQPQPQPQPQQRSYRTDLPPSSSFPAHFGSPPPTRADVFGTSQSLDGLSRFDYDAFGDVPGPPANSAQHAHTQPHYAPSKHNGAFPGSSALLQSQQVQVSKMAQQQQQQQQSSAFAANGVPYLNGGPPPHMQPTANGIGYGPPAHGHTMHHAPGPGPGPGPGLAQAIQQGPSAQQGVRGEQPQEEISTIFVVGFPEDMHEREFQNMFTFSVGFEAATLKIPNKDSSAYGPAAGASGAAGALRQAGFLPAAGAYPHAQQQQGGGAPYTGAQDPYNLVTVNSGGVVVDGPQGTSSSWQQPGGGEQYPSDAAAAHAQAPAMPPRKQIIGFAKFRSRQEALDARDVLQGRRVDIEKGAVLKAEMAKKNLHTKRGVGPLGLPLGLMGGGVVGPEMLAGVPGLGAGAGAAAQAAGGGAVQAGDALSQRDRELGVLGAMGLAGMARRGAQEEEKQRPRDEEARRRQEKELERERNNKLRMSNTTVYDAFHSVPIGPRAGYADAGGPAFPGYAFQNNAAPPPPPSSAPFALDAFGQPAPWGLPTKPPAEKAATLPPRPPSSLQSSPRFGGGRFYGGSDSSTFSPPDYAAPLPPIGPRPPRAAHSPPPQYAGAGSSLPQSSSSSVAGSQSSLEGEFSRTLTVSTHQGMTSPQLPSPGSGGSSNNARQGNASDQNPPINTLYVGNLPNSPVPTGYPPNYLEESLRVLFSRCPGYRKLCFRQKSNGPMCFVEFEDVSYATKALNDLYGNQLNGFVKGGIRLSFSKNPLGVRPTPSTGNSQTSVGGRREPGREWNGHAQSPQQQHQPHPQQQQHSGMPYPSMHDAYQARGPPQQGLSLDIGSGRRHEPANENGSPNMYHYTASSPPPSRFFSPPPSSAQSAFGAMGPSPASAAFPRFSAGLGGAPHSPPFFHDGDERVRFRDAPPHAFSPSPGVETTRAG